MTYAFTHEEIYSLGWAGIWALGLGFGLQGWIMCLRLEFRLCGWDLGCVAGI